MSATKSTNGGEILKLQNKQEGKTLKTAFGTKTQNVQITYYMKVDECPLKVGSKETLDLDMFNIVERPFTIEEGENAGSDIILKWLQIK